MYVIIMNVYMTRVAQIRINEFVSCHYRPILLFTTIAFFNCVSQKNLIKSDKKKMHAKMIPNKMKKEK
jgi:hypothetical protein